jgi:phosphoribosylanthranilate isomerase
MKGMPAIKLKVCGMRDEQNICDIAILRPDYLGFIFYDKSPRYVGEPFIIPAIPSAIKKVGVFVNDEVSEIVKLHENHSLDFVQLHGHETVKEVGQLKKLGIGVIKVFSIHDNFDFDSVKPYQEYSDYFLFDTKGKYYGGNAITFNWRVLEKYDQQIPFFLSGGISLDNMHAVTDLEDMNVHAIDINSRVEIGPALKDPLKVAEVVSRLGNINKEKSEI